MNPAKYLVVTIPIVCASLCLMSEASFAGPQIYTLVVRGGGVVNPKPKGVSSDVVDVTIDFASGTKPAGIALSPGQGAWTDRGMSPDEPKRLSFRTTRRQSGEIVSSL